MGNQTSLYITSGRGGTETFRPTFSYYGVRYAALSGLPADYTPTEKTLTALRVNTLVPRTGSVSFNASVAVLNKIQSAVLYTQQSNIHSHPRGLPAARAPRLDGGQSGFSPGRYSTSDAA